VKLRGSDAFKEREGQQRTIQGHRALELGEDLLGCVMSVRGHTTLEGAMKALGTAADPERLFGWTHVVEEGADWVRVELSGELRRDATVADLVAYLDARAADGTQFFRRDQTKARTRWWGVFPDWDAYAAGVRPLTLAAVASLALGGRGMLSFIGSTTEDTAATLIDFGDGQMRIALPDFQDLDASDWRRRLGRSARGDRALEAWREAHGADFGD
jgi:hypothetical protein